ncbi:MAG: DNA/RNA non-specific endonuclease [Candidatus Kapabacteria bacterium]|nr:DNA/RNA non-specific endonuclease [Candidatus Kapabacteria bacterium]
MIKLISIKELQKRNFIISVLLIIFLLNSISVLSQNSKKHNSSVHLKLGLPVDSDSTDDYLIIRPQYAVSYNSTLNAVNWAGWNLNSSYFGKSGRYEGRFITDTTLPLGIIRMNHDDYTNTGYDRGHLVRSHERSSNPEDNKSTFFMTNIVPQTPDLNRGVWLDFERFCENLVIKQKKELYIYAGGIYKSDSTIGKGIRVPDSCFKIVVALERGEGLECVDYNTKIYCVVMPNVQGIRKIKWRKYAVSVTHIEKSTGYNFLSDVPEKIQGIIEQIVYK